MTGETIYNLIKLNDIHTDDNDRPLDPPKIKKTEVGVIKVSAVQPFQKFEHLEKGRCGLS